MKQKTVSNKALIREMDPEEILDFIRSNPEISREEFSQCVKNYEQQTGSPFAVWVCGHALKNLPCFLLMPFPSPICI